MPYNLQRMHKKRIPLVAQNTHVTIHEHIASYSMSNNRLAN